MEYTTLFLVAYVAAIAFFVTLLIAFSTIERGRDKSKGRPFKIFSSIRSRTITPTGTRWSIMEFGLTFALMHLGLVTFFTVLLIALSAQERRREKKEIERMRMGAARKEYRVAAWLSLGSNLEGWCFMEIALVIDLILFGIFTILLIVLSIDEARQEKKREEDGKPEKLGEVA